MKVAIIHDWLTGMGGAEKVIIELHKMYPDAPIYTSVVDYERLDPIFKKMDIRTTFIQKLPYSKKKYNRYLPLFPLAFEALDLHEYDLIISSTTSIGVKGVLRDSTSVHVCYCNTPPRYAWDFYHEYLSKSRKIPKLFIPILMHYLRQYDQSSSNRVDHFIANSSIVKERINKIYRRDAEVIFPPVDTDRFTISKEDEGFYLVVSRLVQYKRIDLAIHACNLLKQRLIIIGDGEEMYKLKGISGSTIEFLGFQTDNVVIENMQKCKAFIFPGYEDFGITPVEVQACGKPVIAYDMGGSRDTIINNKTGVLFNEQTVNSLINAIQKLDEIDFDSKEIRKHAEKFNTKHFRNNFRNYIERILGENSK